MKDHHDAKIFKDGQNTSKTYEKAFPKTMHLKLIVRTLAFLPILYRFGTIVLW